MATGAEAAGEYSIEEAVAALDAADNETVEAPATVEQPPKKEEQDTEAEPAASDASEPETATADETAEMAEGTEEGEQPELSAIEPPRFWDAEAKKRFGELPRDLQELVLSKETERDRATAKSIEEAALKRKAADGEASRIAQLNGVLDKLLPQAVETFKSRWQGVDWNAVVDQYGADQALKLRNDFEREQGVVQQLQAAKNEAEQVEYVKFVEAENAKLPELVPDLVDPKLGSGRKAELGKFLIDSGIPAENLKHITAVQTSIAYDAMRWRQAQAKARDLAAAPQVQVTKPVATPKPTVKPTARPGNGGSPQSARLQALNSKRVLSLDEAVERLNLMET